MLLNAGAFSLSLKAVDLLKSFLVYDSRHRLSAAKVLL